MKTLLLVLAAGCGSIVVEAPDAGQRAAAVKEAEAGVEASACHTELDLTWEIIAASGQPVSCTAAGLDSAWHITLGAASADSACGDGAAVLQDPSSGTLRVMGVRANGTTAVDRDFPVAITHCGATALALEVSP